MEPSTTFGEDMNVFLHGVWIAGLKISDRLVRNIASEFTQKPSRRCTLALTSRGLDFQVLPSLANPDGALDKDNVSGEVKSGKLQHIVFPALREVSVNPHNQHCLLAVFVDAKNKFSVLVFSCENPLTLSEVAATYKELRNQRVLQSQSRANGSPALATGNWTLRQQNGHSQTNGTSGNSNSQPNIVMHSLNGVSITSIDVGKPEMGQDGGEVTSDDGSSSRGSDVGNGVDVEYEVEREEANSGTDGAIQTFHVSVQVNILEPGSDSDSVSRSGSIRSSVSSQADSTPAETDQEPTSSDGISTEQFHNVRNSRASNDEKDKADKEESSAPSTLSENGHGEEKQNGEPIEAVVVVVKGAFAMRSVGVQTDPMTQTPQRGRYTKKPLKASLSNQYKEKLAAVRKKSGNTTSAPSSPSTNSSPSFGQGDAVQLRPKSTGTIRARPQPTSSFTVSRPIEDVYKRRSSQKGDRHPESPEPQHTLRGPLVSRRVVVLPNNQAVVLAPVQTNGGPTSGGYVNASPTAQRPYMFGQHRLRKVSTNSNTSYASSGGESRNSSRSNSLRIRAQSGLQKKGRPVSFSPPTI